jgi:hypothetical protein
MKALFCPKQLAVIKTWQKLTTSILTGRYKVSKSNKIGFTPKYNVVIFL